MSPVSRFVQANHRFIKSMTRGGHCRRHAVRRLKRPLYLLELHVNQLYELKREFCLPVLDPQIWQHRSEHERRLRPGNVPLVSRSVFGIGGVIGCDRSTKYLQRELVWRVASSSNPNLGGVVSRRPLVPAGSHAVFGRPLDRDEPIRIENSGKVCVGRVHNRHFSSAKRISKRDAGGVEHNGMPKFRKVLAQ
ncbi:hypothetical protein [Mesorhizobium sp. M2A.F.Ca.ET.043.02.1.1]|uniref:hypothetical protein n=1 Tax=Mesorhizobium sp. M2A.F.Ca.ET.043.02.1.1 TaxID=2493670 RepID=UPI000F752377|nr:hypothetical protein [Mesorhizobium sp. M2A.F.Ca.ET.043.02.1.1]AZO04554.1 hypothetical protein EJ068_16910 [Mesorhizobium sp. M2A.F.Ca.ET.043.02.1.1]